MKSNLQFGLETTHPDLNLMSGYANPASGYRNNSDGSMNNVGSNGNYWSASPNSANNGYYLNFNSSNVNPSNNNNRANGFSVRCVQAFTHVTIISVHVFPHLCRAVKK